MRAILTGVYGNLYSTRWVGRTSECSRFRFGSFFTFTKLLNTHTYTFTSFSTIYMDVYLYMVTKATNKCHGTTFARSNAQFSQFLLDFLLLFWSSFVRSLACSISLDPFTHSQISQFFYALHSTFFFLLILLAWALTRFTRTNHLLTYTMCVVFSSFFFFFLLTFSLSLSLFHDQLIQNQPNWIWKLRELDNFSQRIHEGMHSILSAIRNSVVAG